MGPLAFSIARCNRHSALKRYRSIPEFYIAESNLGQILKRWHYTPIIRCVNLQLPFYLWKIWHSRRVFYLFREIAVLSASVLELAGSVMQSSVELAARNLDHAIIR
jgi:hypothetical protein